MTFQSCLVDVSLSQKYSRDCPLGPVLSLLEKVKLCLCLAPSWYSLQSLVLWLLTCHPISHPASGSLRHSCDSSPGSHIKVPQSLGSWLHHPSITHLTDIYCYLQLCVRNCSWCWAYKSKSLFSEFSLSSMRCVILSWLSQRGQASDVVWNQ